MKVEIVGTNIATHAAVPTVNGTFGNSGGLPRRYPLRRYVCVHTFLDLIFCGPNAEASVHFILFFLICNFLCWNVTFGYAYDAKDLRFCFNY